MIDIMIRYYDLLDSITKLGIQLKILVITIQFSIDQTHTFKCLLPADRLPN